MDDLMPDDISPTEDELTRLADGVLPDSECDRIRRLADASPELTQRLQEQSRAVSLMRSTDTVRAPAWLSASIEQMTGSSRWTFAARQRSAHVSIPRWPPRLYLPAASGLVAVVIVVALVIGGHSAPTVEQTGHLALAAARFPAPADEVSDPDILNIREAGISFPSYLSTAERAAAGARRDTLDGRNVTTVFYRGADGTRIGYAIVSGAALRYPSGRWVTAGSTRYVLANLGSANLVTWRRHGHTCVIAGRAVNDRTLLRLAIADDERVS